MARRINTYRLFRQVHLYSGLVCFVFLLWFFLTGYLLTQYQWFPKPEEISLTQEYPLPVQELPSEQAWLEWLRETYQLAGKAEVLRQGEQGEIRFEFLSPRQVQTVAVDPANGLIRIEQQELSAYHVIEAYHRFHTYGREWSYNLYLLGMDLASVSLLIFVLTGAVLWWKLLPNKRLGLLLLLAGIGYTCLVGWELLR